MAWRRVDVTATSRPAVRTGSPRILIIRRDNIGDLVCTTPLVAALRRRYPEAWLGALVNDYSRPVLDNNPDLDEVFSYQKAKHRGSDQGLFGVYWQRLKMLAALRRRRIDYVVLAAPGFQASAERFARLVGARHIIGFDNGTRLADMKVPVQSVGPLHQVEIVFKLLAPLGITGQPPALSLNADPQRVARFRPLLGAPSGPVVGVHISARESNRRWPDAHFAELIDALMVREAATVVLTWAPGGRDRSEFPGDDESARQLLSQRDDKRLLAIATRDLADLIASLSICDVVICSDGGPVHLSAALGKPVVCLFGDERPALWHPWGVPYRLLQPPSQQVRDIAVAEVLSACSSLLAEVKRRG